jgi:hypothetical protein
VPTRWGAQGLLADNHRILTGDMNASCDVNGSLACSVIVHLLRMLAGAALCVVLSVA